MIQEDMDRERLKEVEQEMIQRELEATEQQLQVSTSLMTLEVID
jgi:hypothetical protein